MKLDFTTYFDKVKGCYHGKNIGGTLGAPFECYRGVYNIDRFMQDVSSPIPNDDVDLQLVWLSAVEREGKNIDSHILAEYWNTYVSAVISEYGTAKNNFNMGILPPLSGHMRNENRNSNGAWIRTEIWACLCAGNPSLAATYAYYDSCVDHSGEGVYSAIFTAAVQAAAFFESDAYKLIDIGLSYIPNDCGVARAVKVAIDGYKSKATWQQTRLELFKAVPSSFGNIGGYWKGNSEVAACLECPAQTVDTQIPAAEHGYDAPWSIGAIVLGWLYGEGDFGKSVCLAVNCGEDTDCTAGTLGSILGIIAGEKALPEEWLKGCSNKISTWTLRQDRLLNISKSIDDLCKRIVRQTPIILGSGCVLKDDGSYEVVCGTSLKYKDVMFEPCFQEDFKRVLSCGHNTVRMHFRQYNALIKFDDALAKITEGGTKKLAFTFVNRLFIPQYLNVRLIDFPSDWEIIGGVERCVGLEHWHGSSNENGFEIEFVTKNLAKGKYTVIVEISVNGKVTKNYIPLVFINGAC